MRSIAADNILLPEVSQYHDTYTLCPANLNMLLHAEQQTYSLHYNSLRGEYAVL